MTSILPINNIYCEYLHVLWWLLQGIQSERHHFRPPGFYCVVGGLRHTRVYGVPSRQSAHDKWQIKFSRSRSLKRKWVLRAKVPGCRLAKLSGFEGCGSPVGGLGFGWAETAHGTSSPGVKNGTKQDGGASPKVRVEVTEAQGTQNCGLTLQNTAGCSFPTFFLSHCICLPFPFSLHTGLFFPPLFSCLSFLLAAFPFPSLSSFLFASLSTSVPPSLPLM